VPALSKILRALPDAAEPLSTVSLSRETVAGSEEALTEVSAEAVHWVPDFTLPFTMQCAGQQDMDPCSTAEETEMDQEALVTSILERHVSLQSEALQTLEGLALVATEKAQSSSSTSRDAGREAKPRTPETFTDYHQADGQATWQQEDMLLSCDTHNYAALRQDNARSGSAGGPSTTEDTVRLRDQSRHERFRAIVRRARGGTR